jgi:DNA replication protein DnaC
MDAKSEADRFIGIDVSKARVDVHVRTDGTAFHSTTGTDGLAALVGRLTPLRPRRVVLEASGGCEGVVAAAPSEAGLPVAIVNPRRVRKFAGASGRLAKLPLTKDIDDFDFADTPVNEALIRDLAGGAFLTEQRNVVLVGGTGTGKSHLAIAITRACIRGGARGRFYTVVDLVNRVESEARAGRQGRLADYLTRLDFVVLDELGYLPSAQTGGQLLFHLISRLYERTSHHCHY